MDPVRSNNGPRYKHLVDEPAPYDTITVDKLTPIIGGEIGGVDLSRPLGNRTLDEIHRALAEKLVIFFPRPTFDAGSASRLWPPVRRSPPPSGGAARAGQAGADDHLCRQGLAARQWRGLAQRRLL